MGFPAGTLPDFPVAPLPLPDLPVVPLPLPLPPGCETPPVSLTRWMTGRRRRTVGPGPAPAHRPSLSSDLPPQVSWWGRWLGEIIVVG